jgi:hypothetical protein
VISVHGAGPVARVPTAALRTAPCACGGYITADPRTPYHAVVRHNRTIEHLRWWARVRADWQGAA